MLLTLIFLTISILELLICFIVYYASLRNNSEDQKQLRSRFYLFNVSMVLWSLSQNAYNWTNSENAWKYIFEIVTFLAVLVGFNYLLFAKSLAKESLIKIYWILYILLIIVSIIVILFFSIGDIVNQSGVLLIQINPLLDGFVSIVPIIFIIHGVYSLEKFSRKNKKLNPELAKQARFVSRGMIFTLSVIFSCNYFIQIFGVINSVMSDTIAALAPLVFVFIIAFSIFSLKLFNFRAFFYKSIAYLAALTVIFGIYVTVAILVANYILGVDLSLQAEVILAIFSAITAIAYQPLKRFFDRVTNRIFYRDSYNPQDVLNNVNSALVGEIDLYKLLNNSAEIIKTNLKTEYCNYYIDEKAVIDFHIAGTNTKLFVEPKWINLMELVEKDNRRVFETLSDTNDKIAELMSTMQVDCIVKMVSQKQNVGYLITGSKLSGNSYANDDIEILEIIADEVAIAVQNTLRYEEIAKFNITLQKKVDDATAQLKKTNQKLIELDEAKDEFISMASHQLRTPLTSMKGYVSMVLDGDAGQVNEQQKTLLDQAFASSQRMVYLIADLLNVSRLKTGKFVIDTKPTYLPDVVETEISQLKETAKDRELKIIYNKPEAFPILNLDETKMRQVIMNFADNAIYYTPKNGQIDIALKADKNTVSFTVTDTGIGVPKSEQHYLFTKFYRAGNAKKARPDGTGLGLYMAKKVVIASGGAIIFKTTPGKGSVFGFSFPRQKLELKLVDK